MAAFAILDVNEVGGQNAEVVLLKGTASAVPQPLLLNAASALEVTIRPQRHVAGPRFIPPLLYAYPMQDRPQQRLRAYFITALLALAVLSTPRSFSQAPAAQPDHNVLHVKLRLTETVSSASAKVGQPILLEVVDPVQADGKIVIAAGARARATVTTARHRGRNHREGKLVLTVQSVSRVGGGETNLQSATVQKGSGQGMPIFGPCTFPLPADPVGLFRKGEDVVIPKGTELLAAIAPIK